MPTLLMGHGEVIPDQPVTVPSGLTISFLIQQGNKMPFSAAVGALLNAEALQQEGFAFSSSHSEGEVIPNHELVELEQQQRAWYAQVDPEDGSCMYAGQDFDSGLRLCNDPDQCEQNVKNGLNVHTCGGLFSFAWGDPHLVWVSCRVIAGVLDLPQSDIGGQESEARALAAKVLAELYRNPKEFADYFGALEPEEKAIALTIKDVRDWSQVREAQKWVRSGEVTDLTFYTFVEAQSEEERRVFLLEADLKAAHERGEFVHVAGEYLTTSGAPAFLEFARGLDGDARALLNQDPALVDLVDKVEDEIAAAADRV